ncbi:MAG: NAD-dependent epimerase/dehydratase [Pseudonocardia sp.]|nr:NAD-dependent epimerase/dehydratase [Pseudonocardia sp.]
MRALVTGGAGFIGSHLVELLLTQGHQVVALDDLSSGSADNLAAASAHPDFVFRTGSVLDDAAVAAAMDGCDVVFHLAAVVGVARVVDQPVHTLHTNAGGTEVVLTAAFGVGATFLLTSSSEVYGRNPAEKLSESADRVLGPPQVSRWSYSESKAVAELLTLHAWREHRLPTVITRLFNTVGPRQRDMVVPRMLRQAHRGEPITVHGDGRQTRCFCHVSDVVRALVDLAVEPRAHGAVVNVGGEQEVAMEFLARRVIAVTGSASEIRYVPYDEAYAVGFEEVRRRVPDITRARELIGFKPTLDLDDMLRVSVAAG